MYIHSGEYVCLRLCDWIHIHTSTHTCLHMHRQMRHKFAYNASCTCTFNYIDIHLHMPCSRKCLHLWLGSMHIYICVHTYAIACSNTEIRTLTHLCECMYAYHHHQKTWWFVHARATLYMYIHASTCTHAHMHVNMHTYMHTCLHAYIHAYVSNLFFQAHLRKVTILSRLTYA